MNNTFHLDFIKKYFAKVKLGPLSCFFAAVFLLLLVFLNLKDGLVVIQSVFTYGFPDPSEIFEKYYSWWDANFGINETKSLWRLFPLDFLNYILNGLLNFSPFSVHYITISFLFLVAFFSLYSLLHLLFEVKVKIGVVIVSLFYVLNVYIVTQLSSSYFLIIPHVFLPLQILFFIKAMKGNVLKNSIILAIVNFLIFGVNLVFDAIYLFAIILMGFWIVFIKKQLPFSAFLKTLILSSFLSALLIFWWFFPMAISHLMSVENVVYILQSENFYNNQTSVINIFRGLGDWAFFSGYNSIPYKLFSPIYKDSFPIIYATFFSSLLVVFLLFFKKTISRADKVTVLYFLLFALALFIFIGGINSSWFSKDLMDYFFKNIPLFSVFRNTYKWMSLVILIYSILIFIFFNNFTYKRFFLNFLLYISFFLSLCFSSYPIISGQVFQERTKIENVPEYWFNMSDYINNSIDPSNNRILLLPNQYSNIFNWGGLKTLSGNVADSLFLVSNVYGTCVGCGEAESYKMINFVFDNIDNNGIDKFLGFLNISYILQRNDFFYSYYANTANPLEVKKTLSKMRVSLDKSFGKLDLYAIDKKIVYPKIYSPDYVYIMDDKSDYLDFFRNVEEENVAFIDSDQYIDSYFKANYFKKLSGFELDDGFEYAKSSVNIPIEGEYVVRNNNKAEFDSINIEVAEDNVYIDTKLKGEIVDPEVLLFENVVANCRMTDKNAKLEFQNVFDTDIMNFVNELSADKDNACVSSKNIKNFNNADYYAFSFDYKVIEGESAGFCLWDGKKCLVKEYLKGDGKWNNYVKIFKPNNDSKKVNVYLYAFAENSPSKVRYGNVKIGLFTKDGDIIDSGINLSEKFYSFNIKLISDNLSLLNNFPIPDTSKDDEEVKVSNCRETKSGASLRGRIVMDTDINSSVLELSADKDNACVSSKNIKNFNNADYYAFSFDYKVIEGESAGFCLWDGKKCLVKEYLKGDGKWNNYAKIFKPNNDSKKVNVYLYAFAENSPSKVRYGNVEIKRIGNNDLDSYYLTNKERNKTDSAEIDFTRINSALYHVNAKGGPGFFLILQESFSPGWGLAISDSESFLDMKWLYNETISAKHYLINNYANAWYVDVLELCKNGNKACKKNDDGSYDIEMVVEFWPQRWFYLGLLISGTTLVGCVGYLGYDFVRNRKKRRKEKKRMEVSSE